MTAPQPEGTARDAEASDARGTGPLLYQYVRRGVTMLVGFSVLLVGIVMLVTPGPAVVVIPLGLGILAAEFTWARRLLQRFKEGGEQVIPKRWRKYFRRIGVRPSKG